MRTTSFITALAFSAGLFWACSGDDDGPVITASDKPVITAPTSGSSYILMEENADQQADRFVWNKANFNVPTQINYSLQADFPGNDFQSPAILGETTATQLAVSVEHLNNTATTLGLTPDEATAIEVRVVASVSDDFDKLISEAINISIVPYSTEAPGPSYLWVPGSYQAAGGYGSDWSPAEAPQLKSSATSASEFEGYVYFAGDAEYKFTAAPEWGNGEYGDGGSGTLLLNDGANLSVSAGYYRIQVDTEALTYDLLDTSWGVIGDATPGGWDADTDMAYNAESKTWTITMDLQAGEIKFRANDSWDLNLGDDGADGSLEEGSANIAIAEAGNYTIVLDLSNPREYNYAVSAN
ncbi:SusE domain-containing protein [Sinomicrobium weinanense]|uniref:SusE domain-containing protein n=1 Tax=Sinomicrobium weinanense TaxID=2842200 RepID=A0A926JWE2_9FLAO|nr:SusE domain-containing protein [Sinomicrobium weinanense]MBC9798408.1 SusE domain-containing protein [Sinomicrobium weinanense]MBU3125105.1 SusE domain-containing protein [Sinomicrobium weinanense]